MPPKTTKIFDKLYRALNPEQREAVDAIEGPVMVIAGPGTGKTHLLTLRIANILRLTQISPDNILTLTFTESAAHAMRRRLVETIGPAGYRVAMHTFHGFCNEVIRRYPESFERIIASTSVGTVEQIRTMEDIIRAARLKLLKPYGEPFHYLIDILAQIRELKREGFTPDDFRRAVLESRAAFVQVPDLYYENGRFAGNMRGRYRELEKNIEKNRELATLYRRYQEELAKRQWYDYEDMIMEVVRVLGRDRDLLLSLQEQYHYVLADEHQDANRGQNEILKLLTSFHEQPNIFVVGDEKQAIFRFQGASLENFFSFERTYPGARLIALTRNYRSTQKILDAAGSVIDNNPVPDERLRVPLKAATRGVGQNISVYGFSTIRDELLFIARDARRRIEEGTPPEEIAVIYRDNKDAFPLVAALEKVGVPHTVRSDQDVLRDEDIGKIILLLRAIEHPHDNERLAQILFIDFLNIEPVDVYNALRYRSRKQSPLLNVLSSRRFLKEAEVLDTTRIHDLYKKVAGWSTLAKNKSVTDVLEVVVRESGLLATILDADDAAEKIRKLETFFEEIRRALERHKEYSLGDVLRYLGVLERYNVALRLPPERGATGVELMTAHHAKGLEFDQVYIIGAVEGHWGGRRVGSRFRLSSVISTVESSTTFFEESGAGDERRLFYVAVTRARKSVSISFARENEEGRHVLPSQFVEEIRKDLVAEQGTEVLERSFVSEKAATAFAPRVRTRERRINEHSFLARRFLEEGLSVTALNNFFNCPWRYFFENLIRVPHAPSKHQRYGIAVHETLKDFFNTLRPLSPGGEPQGGKRWSKKQLLRAFSHTMEKNALSDRDLIESREKGRKALGGYYDAYKKSLTVPLFTEYRVRGVELQVPIEEKLAETLAPLFKKDFKTVRKEMGIIVSITLNGVLDKIEPVSEVQIDDKNRTSDVLQLTAGHPTSSSLVNVVDYKTGRPRSRNDIEGKTKSSQGEYKRQLIFYKLLLDRFERGSFEMVSGEIDFVEPDPRGKYHKERFIITPEEVLNLKEEIQGMARKVLSLSFWTERCGDKKCRFCALREMMK